MASTQVVQDAELTMTLNPKTFNEILMKKCVKENNFIRSIYGVWGPDDNLKLDCNFYELGYINYLKIRDEYRVNIRMDSARDNENEEVFNWLLGQFREVMTSNYMKLDASFINSYGTQKTTSLIDRNGEDIPMEKLIECYLKNGEDVSPKLKYQHMAIPVNSSYAGIYNSLCNQYNQTLIDIFINIGQDNEVFNNGHWLVYFDDLYIGKHNSFPDFISVIKKRTIDECVKNNIVIDWEETSKMYQKQYSSISIYNGDLYVFKDFESFIKSL